MVMITRNATTNNDYNGNYNNDMGDNRSEI